MDFFSSGYTTDAEIREDPEPEFVSLDQEDANLAFFNEVAGILAAHEANEAHEAQLAAAAEPLAPHFDAHEYENLQEQLVQVSQSNFELMERCREIEMERRIAKRSVPTKLKDRVIHWKNKVKRVKQKAKAWITRKFGSSAEIPSSSRYEDILYERYYPGDMRNFDL